MPLAEDDKLTCVLRTRVSQKTFDRLEKLFGQSNVRTMAEFVRAIIQKGKINWYHRNSELDALAVEFGLIRKELNAIGRNINQITRAFHHTHSPAYRSVSEGMGALKHQLNGWCFFYVPSSFRGSKQLV